MSGARLVILLGLFGCLGLLVGCGATVKVAQVQPGAGVGDLRLGMSLPEVERKAGLPRIKKWLNDGISYSYPSSGINVFASGDPMRVSRITAGSGFAEKNQWMREFWGKTREGIGIGSTREQILRVYGLPEAGNVLLDYKPRIDEGSLVYRRLGIAFLMHENKVIRMTIFPPDASPATRKSP